MTTVEPTWTKPIDGITHLGQRYWDPRSATIEIEAHAIQCFLYTAADGNWPFQVNDCDTVEEAHTVGARWVNDGVITN